jgi:hypothetical protein
MDRIHAIADGIHVTNGCMHPGTSRFLAAIRRVNALSDRNHANQGFNMMSRDAEIAND